MVARFLFGVRHFVNKTYYFKLFLNGNVSGIAVKKSFVNGLKCKIEIFS